MPQPLEQRDGHFDFPIVLGRATDSGDFTIAVLSVDRYAELVVADGIEADQQGVKAYGSGRPAHRRSRLSKSTGTDRSADCDLVRLQGSAISATLRPLGSGIFQVGRYQRELGG
jgi:hypothetical protein